MEDSLSKNELKNFTKRAHFGNSSPNPFKKDSKSQAKKSAKDGGNSWVDRSRSIREALMTKLDIQWIIFLFNTDLSMKLSERSYVSDLEKFKITLG